MDKDPAKKEGEFEDLSSVEKYEMSTEDYSKRTGRSQTIGYLVVRFSLSMQAKTSWLTTCVGH